MFGRIDSRRNERYKTWYAISHLNRGRKTDAIWLEGLRLCADAVQSGIEIKTILTADSASAQIAGFIRTLPDTIERWTLPDALFQTLCDTEHPQGVALICRSPVLQNEARKPVTGGLYLVADGIADPGNLGSMIRTADAFAFDGILFTRGTVWPMNPKVIRAAMGSFFHVPLIVFEDIAGVAHWLTQEKVPLIAADPHGSQTVAELEAGGAALLIGNEAHGLSDAARKLADAAVAIPMPGRSESLNAAAAAAILACELMKKRMQASVTGI